MNLLMVIPLTAMMFSLGMGILSQIEAIRQAQVRHTSDLEARSMALSGLDFGRSLLQHGRWKGPQDFRSPTFASGGSFQLEVRRLPSGAYSIRSEGRCGRQVWVEGQTDYRIPSLPGQTNYRIPSLPGPTNYRSPSLP